MLFVCVLFCVFHSLDIRHALAYLLLLMSGHNNITNLSCRVSNYNSSIFFSTWTLELYTTIIFLYMDYRAIYNIHEVSRDCNFTLSPNWGDSALKLYIQVWGSLRLALINNIASYLDSSPAEKRGGAWVQDYKHIIVDT